MKTILDTGSVSGNNLPVNFTIDENSSGNISITVEAPKSGTQWEFTLTSEGFKELQAEIGKVKPGESMVVGEHMGLSKLLFPVALGAAVSATDVSADAAESWRLVTKTGSVLTEGDVQDTPGPGFIVERQGSLDSEAEIGWRVKPSGANPVSAADFEGGVLPEAVVTVAAGQGTTYPVYFQFVDESGEPFPGFHGLVKDGAAEGVETFEVELFDPETGMPLSSPTAGETVFSVHDDFGFVDTSAGTDQGELLVGDDDSNVITGKGGADTLRGLGGEDIL